MTSTTLKSFGEAEYQGGRITAIEALHKQTGSLQKSASLISADYRNPPKELRKSKPQSLEI